MSTKLRKDNQIIYGKEIFAWQKFKQSWFQATVKITLDVLDDMVALFKMLMLTELLL